MESIPHRLLQGVEIWVPGLPDKLETQPVYENYCNLLLRKYTAVFFTMCPRDPTLPSDDLHLCRMGPPVSHSFEAACLEKSESQEKLDT